MRGIRKRGTCCGESEWLCGAGAPAREKSAVPDHQSVIIHLPPEIWKDGFSFRSRHLSSLCPAKTLLSWLDRRTNQRTKKLYRWPDRSCWLEGKATPAETCRLSSPVPPRFPDSRRRGQDSLQQSGWW